MIKMRVGCCVASIWPACVTHSTPPLSPPLWLCITYAMQEILEDDADMADMWVWLCVHASNGWQSRQEGRAACRVGSLIPQSAAHLPACPLPPLSLPAQVPCTPSSAAGRRATGRPFCPAQIPGATGITGQTVPYQCHRRSWLGAAARQCTTDVQRLCVCLPSRLRNACTTVPMQSTMLNAGQDPSSYRLPSALGLGKGHASEADVQYPLRGRWASRGGVECARGVEVLHLNRWRTAFDACLHAQPISMPSFGHASLFAQGY